MDNLRHLLPTRRMVMLLFAEPDHIIGNRYRIKLSVIRIIIVPDIILLIDQYDQIAVRKQSVFLFYDQDPVLLGQLDCGLFFAP